MNVSNPCNIYNSQLSLHGEGKTRDRVNEFEGSQTPQAKHLKQANHLKEVTRFKQARHEKQEEIAKPTKQGTKATITRT